MEEIIRVAREMKFIDDLVESGGIGETGIDLEDKPIENGEIGANRDHIKDKDDGTIGLSKELQKLAGLVYISEGKEGNYIVKEYEEKAKREKEKKEKVLASGFLAISKSHDEKEGETIRLLVICVFLMIIPLLLIPIGWVTGWIYLFNLLWDACSFCIMITVLCLCVFALSSQKKGGSDGSLFSLDCVTTFLVALMATSCFLEFFGIFLSFIPFAFYFFTPIAWCILLPTFLFLVTSLIMTSMNESTHEWYLIDMVLPCFICLCISQIFLILSFLCVWLNGLIIWNILSLVCLAIVTGFVNFHSIFGSFKNLEKKNLFLIFVALQNLSFCIQIVSVWCSFFPLLPLMTSSWTYFIGMAEIAIVIVLAVHGEEESDRPEKFGEEMSAALRYGLVLCTAVQCGAILLSLCFGWIYLMNILLDLTAASMWIPGFIFLFYGREFHGSPSEKKMKSENASLVISLAVAVGEFIATGISVIPLIVYFITPWTFCCSIISLVFCLLD